MAVKLGRKNGNGISGTIFGHHCLQPTEYQYVRTLTVKTFFIMISVSDTIVPQSHGTISKSSVAPNTRLTVDIQCIFLLKE